MVEDYLTLCEVGVYGPQGNVVENHDMESEGELDIAKWVAGGDEPQLSFSLGTKAANGFDKRYLTGSGKSQFTLTQSRLVRKDTKYRLTFRYKSSGPILSNDPSYSFIIPANKRPASILGVAYFEATANAPLSLSVNGLGSFLEIDDIQLETVNFINRAFINIAMPDSSSLAILGIRLTDVSGKPSCGDLTLSSVSGRGGDYKAVALIQSNTDEPVNVRAGSSKSWRLYGMPTQTAECSVEVDVMTRLADPEQQQCLDMCEAPSQTKFTKIACRVGCDIAAFGASTESNNGLFDVTQCSALLNAFASSERVDPGFELEDLEGSCVAATRTYSYSKIIECPEDMTIESIAFASYGNPSGSCASTTESFQYGTCHADESKSVVEASCVGKQQCTIVATNEAFGGDPCQGTRKRLAVEANCVLMSAGLSKRVPFRLTVQAKDEGGLTTTSRVLVNVADVNEPPVIQDAETDLLENVKTGTLVGIPMKASDPDVTDELTFSVVGGTGASMFRVDRNSGQVSAFLKKDSILNFEKNTVYTVQNSCH